MSALWAPSSNTPEDSAADWSAPESSGPESGTRGVLRGLPRPKPRLARIPFLLVLIAVFGVGMTGLLMLNTRLQSQAFEVSNLTRQANELTYTQADLDSKIDQLAAPQELALRASTYGMRANPYPAFLVLPKGRVVGKPERVRGNEMPVLVVKTPAELAAERAAAAVRAQALADQRAAEATARARRAAANRAGTPSSTSSAGTPSSTPSAASSATPQPTTKQPTAKQPTTKQPTGNPSASQGTATTAPGKPGGRG